MASQNNIMSHLERTFGKLNTKIKDNLKYFTYSDEDDEFDCKVCGKIIQLSDDQSSTTRNFLNHLDSKLHKSKTVPTSEIWNRLKATFSNKIPKLVLSNAEILGMDGSDFYCEICYVTISVSKYTDTLEKNFAQHFLTDNHENNLECYRDNFGRLEEIYGCVPEAVVHNSQYLALARDQVNYVCGLCDVNLRVSRDLEETEKMFTSHLESESHVKKHQHERAFVKIPQLRQIYTTVVPLFVLKNVDYLSFSQTNIPALYCSLCDECVEFDSLFKPKESLDNLKNHLFSVDHVNTLRDRKYSNNELYFKLSNNEELDDDTHLKFHNLTMIKNKIYCKLCKLFIYKGIREDHLKAEIVNHLKSRSHNLWHEKTMELQSDVLHSLDDLFGAIPSCIYDELDHLEFRGGCDFECTLCNKVLKTVVNGDYEENTEKTEENFTKHLETTKHREEVEAFQSVDDDLEDHLKLLCKSAEIPQHLSVNMKHFGYKNNKQTEFFCFLCDQEINIDHGSKNEELTLMNLRNHFFSHSHLKNMKNTANNKCQAKHKLRDVFGGVSSTILNNIDHLEKMNDNKYYCKLCDIFIIEGGNADNSQKNFHSHLLGETHRYNINTLEQQDEQAQKKLAKLFDEVPEFILRNMDFLNFPDDDIYCTVCQVTLPLEDDVTLKDNHTIRYHLESKSHENNVGR